ncbi:hypothetical protein C8F01DRAFT_1231072 [Mycena amicta]|nr:hypothetical protein C8F01DRAFT_1231072 [Mycena amicta]
MSWGYDDEGGRRADDEFPRLSAGSWMRKARRNPGNALPGGSELSVARYPVTTAGKRTLRFFPSTMSVHRATVPPSFEPGAAPDTQQHSQYASLARPLLVAASHSLQNDSQPCYDPLLAVCSSGPGNISWGVVDIETLLFASYKPALQLDPSFNLPSTTRQQQNWRELLELKTSNPLEPYLS